MRDENYVVLTVRTIGSGHISYGVRGAALYVAFVAALRDVLAELHRHAWTAQVVAAWRRLCAALIQPVSEQCSGPEQAKS